MLTRSTSAQAQDERAGLAARPTCVVSSRRIKTIIMAAMTAPKLKQEYVANIAALTKVSPENLNKHDLDRLKAISMTIKPSKPTPVETPGWKKSNLFTLQQMYFQHFVEELGRIMELEFYAD